MNLMSRIVISDHVQLISLNVTLESASLPTFIVMGTMIVSFPTEVVEILFISFKVNTVNFNYCLGEDGSDEQNCALRSCSSDQWKCNNGNCIRANYQCDGDNDCKFYSRF